MGKKGWTYSKMTSSVEGQGLGACVIDDKYTQCQLQKMG